MDRRRTGGAPALWRRVRWGNVGWLVAFMGAAVLIATNATGGGAEAPELVPAPVEALPGEAPLPAKAPPREDAGAVRPLRERRRVGRPRPRRRREPSGLTKRAVEVPAEPRAREPLPPAVPVPAPAPGPLPTSRPPGEFAPGPLP